MGDKESYSVAYPWIVVLFTLGAYALTFVDRLAWASVAVVAGPSLGMSVVSLGAFVTGFYAAYVVSNAASGFLADRVGPRLTILCALVPLGLFTFFFNYTPSLLVGMTIQAGMGLSAGVNYPACVKLVASWFPLRSRGKPMALLLLGSSLGVALTNAIIPTFLKHFGWRGAYKCIGIITIIWGILAYLVVRDGPSKQIVRVKPNYKPLFQNRNLLFLALAGFGGFWGTVGFISWANALMIKGHHISIARAGLVVALFGVGAFIDKPVIGAFADWLGEFYKVKVLSICCLASFAIMLLVFGRMNGETAFLITAPFLGFTAYSYATTMSMMITEEATIGLAGSAIGLTNALWQLSGTIVPLVVGVVFQATHSFYVAFLILASGPTLGAVMLLFVRGKGTHVDG
jgi:sugar phosphate permease